MFHVRELGLMIVQCKSGPARAEGTVKMARWPYHDSLTEGDANTVKLNHRTCKLVFFLFRAELSSLLLLF